MRLFLATFTPFNYINLKKELEENVITKAKFVPQNQLHMTIKFFKEVNNYKFIEKKLNNFNYEKRLISIKGIDYFKTQNNIIIYAKVEKLPKEIYNFPFLNDNFKPHITLCRAKKLNETNLKNIAKKYNSHLFGNFLFQVCLVESKLTPKGPIYTILKKF